MWGLYSDNTLHSFLHVVLGGCSDLQIRDLSSSTDMRVIFLFRCYPIVLPAPLI